jgi:hypothetical protein
MAGNAVMFGTVPATSMPQRVNTDGNGAMLVSTSVGGVPSNVAQGSATAGQNGGLELGAVQTNAPAYTSGQTSALSMNTEGYQRVVTPDLASPTFWNYAGVAGGIVNSAVAVTLKAAAGAGVRNFCKSLQLSTDALAAATEIAIRDGAAGTVIWRGKLQTTALAPTTINFDPPLKGTANTLMEFVTLTASVTGGVFVDAQGYTGT